MKQLIAFFSSYEDYLPYCKELKEQEYQDILYGTNSKIYVPLWASCKNNEKILNNEITLDVTKFYKKYGYKSVPIDGNPLDYLGNQLLFLQYLANAQRQDVIEEFIDFYYLDTAQNFIQHLPYKNLDTKEVKEKLLNILREPIQPTDSISLNPPIEVEPYRTICSAGTNNCGGRCRIDIGIQEGCILNLDTDRKNTIPIRSCVRGKAYKRTYLSSERLRYPMKRIGKRGEGKFTRITYEEAAKTIADKMVETMDKYGYQSRYIMYASGQYTYLQGKQMMERLLNLQGGCLGFYNSYSSACASYITPYVYGDACSGNSEEDIINTEFCILWGHNPAETIFGARRNYYLSKLKEKGVKIVCIDPRRSDSAIAYGEWIGIKPSTDSALADAMAYVIYKNNLQDQHFIDTFCIGFDKNHMPQGYENEENVHDYLFGLYDGIRKTPEWASAITGIPAQTIEELAIQYATAKPACILPGLGLQRTITGEQAERGVMMLACLTGNVGIPGGCAAGANWTDEHLQPTFPFHQGRKEAQIPTFLWSKAIHHGTEMSVHEDGLQGVDHLDSNIKLIFNLAGNTLINQHSNINETVKILEDESACELIVGSDVFMTPSAKFFDILLPGTSMFEGDNIPFPWTYGHYLVYSAKVMEPLFECKFEYEWISMVAKELGLYEEYTEGKSVQDWLQYCYKQIQKLEPKLPAYEIFQQEGGFVYEDAKTFIAYEDQIQKGVPFNTPSGKIEIFSPRLLALNNPEEIPGIPKYVPSLEGVGDPLMEKYPLQLIGYHTKRRCHSIHDNNDYLEKVDPPALWIHPNDAKKRNIQNNDLVLIYNDRGKVRIPAKVTEHIMEGVVAMSQGGWYTPDEEGVDTRGSINVLTMTHKPSPVAKGNPQHTNLVEVERV